MILELLKVFSFLSLFLFCFIVLGILFKKTIEYIEANPFATETFSKNLLCLFILAHFYLVYIKLPKISILLSLISHFTFLWFYNDYPILKVKDARFIVAFILTFINHFNLIVEFRKGSIIGWHAFIGFIIFWGTPIIISFNLSANQHTVVVESKKRKTAKILGNIVEWFQSLQIKVKH